MSRARSRNTCFIYN